MLMMYHYLAFRTDIPKLSIVSSRSNMLVDTVEGIQ